MRKRPPRPRERFNNGPSDGDAMDALLAAAALMAFLPTLLLMYSVLRKYTYPAVSQPFFSDPSFFFLFSMGLLAGTALLAVYTYIWLSLVYVMLFALVEVLAFTALFNLKRFRGGSDTVFYGYGFGLGVGCTFALGFIYFIARTSLQIGVDVDIPGYVQLAIYGLVHILAFSAIGTTVAEGMARHRVLEFALQALLLNVALALVLKASFLASSATVMWLCAIAALAIAAGYFYRNVVRNLSRVVRDVLKADGKKRDDIPR